MYKNKTIGIWGLGKVGLSVARFMHAQGATILGMDKKDLSAFDNVSCITAYYSEEQKNIFFARVDYIVSSPGIDIRPYYQEYKSKWLTELDIFYQYWQKPIIAITGSVGKTSITTLLGQLLPRYGARAVVAGNIGNPMLDLIPEKNKYDSAILEVSSFQLEYCTSFAPDKAVWTNFVPNHLDRHTLEQYFMAKTNILANQTEHQIAIIPLGLLTTLRDKFPHKKYHIISQDTIAQSEKDSLTRQGHTLFITENNILYKQTVNGTQELITMNELPNVTFISNWLAICALLDSFGYELNLIPLYAQDIAIPEHRMEKIARESSTFYNDSKATTPTSTLSAIERLEGQDIILFLGGLSKGVDRSNFVRTLHGKVKRVYCFGTEADALDQWCNRYLIPSSSHATLDEAFNRCMQQKNDQEIVLFSPSGSSYDLFKNYEERGTYFKQLITDYFESEKKRGTLL